MIDADRVREVTDEVLSRPGYRELTESPAGRLLAEVRSWFAERLFDLFGGTAAAGVGVVVAVLVVTVVVLAGVVALLGVQRGRGVDVVVPTGSTLTSVEADAAADAARAAGDHTAAVRERYSALVLLLQERGALQARPGTTVGEVDAVAATSVPAAGDAVRSAGVALADVVYGHQPATPRHDDVVAAAVRDVDRALPRRPAVA